MSQNLLPNANSVSSDKKLISVREAAAILQRSPSAVYQAIKASPPRLHYADPVRRLIAREGLEQRWARSTRARVDCPVPSAERSQRRYWDRFADTANEMLDCDAWSGPPWNAERWAVLVGVMQQANDSLR
jgi:hypothetical protein